MQAQLSLSDGSLTWINSNLFERLLMVIWWPLHINMLHLAQCYSISHSRTADCKCVRRKNTDSEAFRPCHWIERFFFISEVSFVMNTIIERVSCLIGYSTMWVISLRWVQKAISFIVNRCTLSKKNKNIFLRLYLQILGIQKASSVQTVI